MWFKQVQIISYDPSIYITTEMLEGHLASFPFTPCLPSLPQSFGWVAPMDMPNNESMLFAINQQYFICMQVEEKILPASVIRYELMQKVKEKEVQEGRKIRSKEKLLMKEDLVGLLLPRAFSKIERIYAYIDAANHRIILGTTNPKKIEQFTQLFKKSITDLLEPLNLVNIKAMMTDWLLKNSYPSSIGLEKRATLQDPQHKNHVITCREQNLQSESIQMILQEGLQIKQLALNWYDRLTFTLYEDLTIRNIGYQDEFKDQMAIANDQAEEQVLAAEMLIMTETLNQLIAELLTLFSKETELAEAL